MTTFPSLRPRQFCVGFVTLIVFAHFAAGQNLVKATVSGKFVGNGKNAAIKFVMVEEHEAFSGKEAITLIFTEKDPATAKKPSFDALFGKLGSALILNVHHDGGIFGCQVSHSAHEKKGFTSLGEIKMVEFKIAGANRERTREHGQGARYVWRKVGGRSEVRGAFAGEAARCARGGAGAAVKPAASNPGTRRTGEPGAETGDPSRAADRRAEAASAEGCNRMWNTRRS